MALGLFGFLFWVVFLLWFVCGRGFVSHTYHGCHVGQCGCSVGGMLTFLVELQVLVHICLFFVPKPAIQKNGF